MMQTIDMAIKLSIFTILLLSLVLTSILWSGNSSVSKPTTAKTASKVRILELTDKEEKLMGSWVEPIPEGGDTLQGFTLYSDGTASSINTGKLLYKEWKVRGDVLSLLVESKGKGLASQDMETYSFEQISNNTLLLKIGKSIFKYKRV
jgi:hypothetical protein